MNYYNEFDPNAAAWLRELIAAGLIPQGEVDERSIAEVKPADLVGFTQCHFFAGVGGWSLALELAGWPASRPIWTGSCPCQPFSQAGKGKGVEDERHLWPVFAELIRACRPQVVIGEQVASAEVVGSELEAAFIIAVQKGDYARANKLAKKLARSKSLHYTPRWLDGVCADLEAEGYTVRSDVLGAHSVTAPHIRQRLYWVAYAGCESFRGGGLGAIETAPERVQGANGQRERVWPDIGTGGASLSGRLGVANGAGSQPGRQAAATVGHGRSVEPSGDVSGLAYADQSFVQGLAPAGQQSLHGDGAESGGLGNAESQRWNVSGNNGDAAKRSYGTAGIASVDHWSDFDIVQCADGKARRIERGTFPLVARFSDFVVPGGDPSESEAQATGEARVMRLKGYGNAIVPQVAAQFIRAFMEVKGVLTD